MDRKMFLVDTYRCTYEYTVDGQTYTGYAIQKNSGRSKGWDRYIYYNKSNPEICYGTSYGEYLHIVGYLLELVVGGYCGLLVYWGIREKIEKDKN